MAVSYVPTFTHTDWIDNVDRVRAAGANGFNERFHALEAEFKRLQDVVREVSEALDQVGHTPTPQPQQLTLVPILAPLKDQAAWVNESPRGEAVKPSNPPVASVGGMMSVPVPDHVQLLSLRAIGQTTGSAKITVALFRERLLAEAALPAPDPLARAEIPSGTSPFQGLTPVNASFSRVDLGSFSYFITANVQGAVADTVRLSAIQLTFIAD